jgi:nicotinamidase/pyrazinamidase
MARGLIIVDFQNDFTPGGALAVADGDAIAPRVEELARSGDFDFVVATRDWHPPNHKSFAAQGGPWPAHCVQGTPGAELHRSLDRSLVDAVVDKGFEPHVEGYSGFEETNLEQLLRDHDVDHVTLVGLATDYCVKETALDALRLGFGATVDTAGVRAIDAEPGDGERALDAVRAAGGTVATRPTRAAGSA